MTRIIPTPPDVPRSTNPLKISTEVFNTDITTITRAPITHTYNVKSAEATNPGTTTDVIKYTTFPDSTIITLNNKIKQIGKNKI